MTMRTLARQAGWRLPLTGLALLLLTTAGCFQPTGAALEATQIAQAAPPTFTPPPTETLIPSVTPTPADTLPPTITPSPEPPTLTPSPTETPTLAGFPTLTETPTPNLFVTVEPTRFVSLTPVAVAQLPNQPLDPILQTATALALQAGIGTGLQQIQPTQPVVQQPVITDPLLLTATAVIAGATLTQAAPMTLTMQAIQGPSPTFAIIQPTTGIITQAPGVFPTATPAAPVISGTDCIHQVQATDRNLFRISLAYGVTVNQIAAASGIANPALIFVGQQLTIPGCGTTGFRPPPTTPPTAAFPSDPNTTNPGTNVCGPVYVVQQGDTLFEISLRCGVPVMTIANLNGITNINLIFINQDLRLQ